MKKNKIGYPSEKLRDVVVKGMQEKKANDIVVVDLRDIGNSIADFLVICTGTSDTQVDALSDSIDKEVHVAFGESPWHSEGKTNKEWILLDYVNVVAHIFTTEKRAFFGLENLWGDAKVTHIDTTN